MINKIGDRGAVIGARHQPERPSRSNHLHLTCRGRHDPENVRSLN